MDKYQQIKNLLDKYVLNQCSDQEVQELFAGIASGQYDDLLGEHIMQQMKATHTEGAALETPAAAAIVQHILTHGGQQTISIRRTPVKNIFKRFVAVAAVVLCVLTGLAVWYALAKNSSSSKDVSGGIQYDGSRVRNTTGNVMLIRLPDSSRISLQPGAVLAYQKDFNAEKREVYLEGEAFFDIAHNAGKPFVVYHEKLMTRVLGTKFFIRYNKQLKEAEVEVTAGRVEVSENIAKNNHQKRNNGVVITPNQKVVYAEDKRLFSTILVDDPQPLVASISPEDALATAPSYEFDATPMSVITDRLRKDYGIEIQMENEEVKNCLFSGDITKQHLYEKLDILCKAIGISYELKGTCILIKGKGCPQHQAPKQ